MYDQSDASQSHGGSCADCANASTRPGPECHRRVREGHDRCVDAGRDGGGIESRSHREGPDGDHGHGRRLPHREPVSRHLHGDVHAAGIHDRQARRARASEQLRGHGECRTPDWRARGNGRRHRRVAGGGHDEHRARPGDHARAARSTADWQDGAAGGGARAGGVHGNSGRRRCAGGESEQHNGTWVHRVADHRAARRHPAPGHVR